MHIYKISQADVGCLLLVLMAVWGSLVGLILHRAVTPLKVIGADPGAADWCQW